MSTPIRDFKAGWPYHIYNRGNQKQKIFFDDNDYEYFQTLLARYSYKFQVSIAISCLMPNHYHMILIPYTEKSISRMMQSIGTAYHFYSRKKYKTIGHIFQGRYKAKRIVDIPYLNTLIRYIRQNPCSKDLSATFEEYKYGYENSELIHDLPQTIKILSMYKPFFNS